MSHRPYYDSSHSLSDDGKYWIDKSTKNGINFLGGMIFNGSKIYQKKGYTGFLQIGLESYPSGITLGLGIVKIISVF